MHLTATFVSSILLAGGALAQYGDSSGMSSSSGSYGSSSNGYGSSSSGSSMNSGASSSNSGSMSSSSDVSVQVVKVSNKNGTLIYSPNNIEAPAGSMVQFQFYPKNHSVVQSTFSDPCTPINNVMSNVTGIFSGFMPTQDTTGSMMPTFTIMINDTQPIWFYCSQAKHCQAGMVGAINAPMNSNKTVEAYAALAKTQAQNLSPGESSDSSATASNSSSGSGSSSTTTGGIVSSTTSAASPSVYATSKELLMGATLASVLVAFMTFAM